MTLERSNFWMRYFGKVDVKSAIQVSFEFIKFYLQFANPFPYLEMKEN